MSETGQFITYILDHWPSFRKWVESWSWQEVGHLSAIERVPPEPFEDALRVVRSKAYKRGKLAILLKIKRERTYD